MEFKIDTKEKFHAITIKEAHFTANMTEELGSRLLPLLQTDVKKRSARFERHQNHGTCCRGILVKTAAKLL